MKIILIGFMGAGKTSVAQLLSKKINLPYVEMDDLILKKSKKTTINKIFEKDGELRFRELEIAVSKDLANRENLIVSTGGGVVMNKINLDYLKKEGKICYLKTSFLKIRQRLEGDCSRPLFKDKKQAKKLFKFRQPLYEKYADIIIETNSKSITDVVNSLISYLS